MSEPIFFKLQTYDEGAQSKYNISSEVLMENAASGMARFIKKRITRLEKRFRRARLFGRRVKVCVVCGSGNNGGDGYAMARMLADYADVKVISAREPKTELCKLQAHRLRLLGISVVDGFNQPMGLTQDQKNKLKAIFATCDILVDAFLGTGVLGSLDEASKDLIALMNEAPGLKVACDVPSGLSVYGNPAPVAFVADYTLTAGALKEQLFSDNGKDYVGAIKTISLGLPAAFYAPKTDARVFLLEKKDALLPNRRRKNCHKGDFGHAIICVGEKTGASVLAGLGALRSGAGKVTLCGNPNAQVPPDLMTATDFFPAQAYCIGPGLTQEPEKRLEEFFEHFFEAHNSLGFQNANPCDGAGTEMEQGGCGLEGENLAKQSSGVVFDADALKTRTFAQKLPELFNVVLTPHVKEFLCLLENLNLHFENELGEPLTTDLIQRRRFFFAEKFSKHFPNCVLVLKGANPIIANNGMLYVCRRGLPSLAKAGSGDVLAGVITGLLAQGYSPLEASQTGVLMHAEASHYKRSYALLASDLLLDI